MMFEMNQALKSFLEDLYTDELKKTVLQARAKGEMLTEIGMKLGVTREFVRQVEAKITRKFALSQSGRKILDSLANLNASDAACVPDSLRVYFGDHYSEMVYLLCLYKSSPFYDGMQLENFVLRVDED